MLKTLIIFSFLLFILFGCSRLNKEKVENYTQKTSIYSTKNLIFYKIYSYNKSYSRFKIKKNESYLCIHKVDDAISNQCLDYGIQGEELPYGTEILISGNIVKTDIQGISLGGYTSFVYLEGFLYKNEKIWLTDFELDEIFEDKEKIDVKNKEAYKILNVAIQKISDFH